MLSVKIENLDVPGKIIERILYKSRLQEKDGEKISMLNEIHVVAESEGFNEIFDKLFPIVKTYDDSSFRQVGIGTDVIRREFTFKKSRIQKGMPGEYPNHISFILEF